MPVRKGTQEGKAVGIVQSGHPAAFKKMRCPDCKVGMLVQGLGADGKKRFSCNRCNRSYAVKEM